jgi:hypothetical protein
MIFLLASTRSGSTLLRVMLAGHPELFSPPELNLLPFHSMSEREATLRGLTYCAMPCDLRVGLLEAVMRIKQIDALRAGDWLHQLALTGVLVSDMYRELQRVVAPRRLVDKSTLNCSCIDYLHRSRWISPGAQYIHLVRHPYAVIESAQQMYFRSFPRLEGFRNAEALWAIPNWNAIRFLETVPDHQKLLVRFEDLVHDSPRVARVICEFLGIPDSDAVLRPYDDDRMTHGSPGNFVSLGDPHFNDHERIDPDLGDAWRRIELPGELSALSRQLSERFEYALPSRRTIDRKPLKKAEEVILVVPPATYRYEAYIDAAHGLGFSPVCALDPSYGVPGSVERWLGISFEFPECAAQVLVAYARSNLVAGILAVDDGASEAAALTSKALGMPYNPIDALAATRNKYVMRMLFQQGGVPSPKFEIYMVCENPHRIARLLTYPVVLKPLYLTGSRGVIRANDSAEFIEAFARIRALLAEPGTGPDPQYILVEQYISGTEVSVDGILESGALRPLAIYDKPDPMEGPFFEETIFTTPSRLSQSTQERIISCAELAAQAIGLRMGPVHVELRVTESGPYLLEVAARTMGGYCSRALPFEGGRTLEELVLSQATNRPIGEFVPASGSHGVMMLPIPGEGVYRAVRGLSQAESTPGITGAMITVPPGSVIRPLPEGDKYVGFLFAEAESPDLVEKALREAHRCLSFDLDPMT